jgi:hypothetical protein
MAKKKVKSRKPKKTKKARVKSKNFNKNSNKLTNIVKINLGSRPKSTKSIRRPERPIANEKTIIKYVTQTLPPITGFHNSVRSQIPEPVKVQTEKTKNVFTRVNRAEAPQPPERRVPKRRAREGIFEPKKKRGDEQQMEERMLFRLLEDDIA